MKSKLIAASIQCNDSIVSNFLRILTNETLF